MLAQWDHYPYSCKPWDVFAQHKKLIRESYFFWWVHIPRRRIPSLCVFEKLAREGIKISDEEEEFSVVEENTVDFYFLFRITLHGSFDPIPK